MKHIYDSECLETENVEIPYENIYSENISEIKKVYLLFKMKFEKRKEFLSEKELDENNNGKPPHVFQIFDPLASVLEFGNGN